MVASGKDLGVHTVGPGAQIQSAIFGLGRRTPDEMGNFRLLWGMVSRSDG
jgi:hypothetical protein